MFASDITIRAAKPTHHGLAKRQGGRGMAIAGLVCGIIASRLWVIVVVAVAASPSGGSS